MLGSLALGWFWALILAHHYIHCVNATKKATIKSDTTGQDALTFAFSALQLTAQTEH